MAILFLRTHFYGKEIHSVHSFARCRHFYVFVVRYAAVHARGLGLMKCTLFVSTLCVLKSPLLQTVWGAAMLWGSGWGGSGHGGRPESIGSVMRWPGAR